VQDWVIRPQLKTVSGVAGIDSIGGYEKQFVVEPDPQRLPPMASPSQNSPRRSKRPISRSAQTLSNAAARRFWSGRWPHPDTRRNLRATVDTRGGVAVAVRDVANVRIGGDLRTGACIGKRQ
jgi:cobalt-zinc-cadmium resistance protein CzcA